MGRNLNSLIVRSMIALTLLAFAVVYFGLTAYFFFIYEWLYPDFTEDDALRTGDIVTLGLLLGIGILTASVLGWFLAKRIVHPLKSVAHAARQIASGDFSARASLQPGNFGEARELINDFNQMAERLQRAESELQYSNSAIAHELRTPLTILRGRLQGLLDGAFSPSNESYARLIGHVDDLSAIVDELRTLALGNAGKLDLECTSIDLAVEAESVLASLEDQFADAGIKTLPSLGRAIVVADRSRMRQVLVALLENCCRYAPQSTVSIETGVSGAHVFIRCSDTGPGLSEENRLRAFERFWRADDSRGRGRGGSGLGLSIVKAIAQAHRGDAHILPSEKAGLAIEIRIPSRENTSTD